MKLFVIKVPIKQTLIYHVRARDLSDAVKKYKDQHPDCSLICELFGWLSHEGKTTFEEVPLKEELD